MSQLFGVRHRNGMWWDGLRYDGNRRAGERWQRHIGVACLFTRRRAADAVARRTGARVYELVPTPRAGRNGGEAER